MGLLKNNATRALISTGLFTYCRIYSGSFIIVSILCPPTCTYSGSLDVFFYFVKKTLPSVILFCSFFSGPVSGTVFSCHIVMSYDIIGCKAILVAKKTDEFNQRLICSFIELSGWIRMTAFNWNGCIVVCGYTCIIRHFIKRYALYYLSIKAYNKMGACGCFMGCCKAFKVVSVCNGAWARVCYVVNYYIIYGIEFFLGLL